MSAIPQPAIIGSLLYGHDAHVIAWVAARIPGMADRSFGPASAIGIVQNGVIVGGAVYSLYLEHDEGSDISVSGAFEPRCRITRAMWRAMFGYAFNGLGCRRMTIWTLRKNREARRFAERTGFRLEGVKRQAFGRQDVMMYGLLKADCKFLPKVPAHG